MFSAGEHVAILGPNGSGKSTLIKTITRECYPLLEPDSQLRILGQENWNIFDLRAHLGIVSNDLMAHCTRDITGRELVLSGFFGSIGIWPNHHVAAGDGGSGADAPWSAWKPLIWRTAGSTNSLPAKRAGC